MPNFLHCKNGSDHGCVSMQSDRAPLLALPRCRIIHTVKSLLNHHPFGLNNILFEFKNMSNKYIHTGYMRIYEDLNGSLWLIEFISSFR